MTTPNMGLTVPTPGTTPGPTYATDVSDALTTIDGHTHTGASNHDGAQIPAAGLNFNADITAQNHNLKSLRSVRFQNQGSPLVAVGDVGCVYEAAGDLWYNNSAGNAVQLTAGPLPIAAPPAFDVATLVANHTINAADPQSFFATNSAGGAIAILLPASDDVARGRFYYFKDETGSAPTHAITITPVALDTIEGGAAGAPFVMSTAHQAVLLINDSFGNWMLFGVGNFGDVTASGDLVVGGSATVTGNVSSSGNVAAGATGHFQFGSRSVTRSVGTIFVNDVVGTSTAAFDFVTVVNAKVGGQSLNLPHGSTLTTCTVTVSPVNLSPPAGTKVAAVISKRNLSTGGVTTLVTTTDPTTGGSYGSTHSFSTAAITEVIDRTLYQYALKLVGETGTGAASCQWFGSTWTGLVAGIDDGVA